MVETAANAASQICSGRPISVEPHCNRSPDPTCSVSRVDLVVGGMDLIDLIDRMNGMDGMGGIGRTGRIGRIGRMGRDDRTSGKEGQEGQDGQDGQGRELRVGA